MVHSDRTAVVFLVPDLALTLILLALSQIVSTLLYGSLTLRHKSIHSSLSSSIIMSNFSSILKVFNDFFTWTALHDVDLHFSLTLVTSTHAVEEEK